MSEYEGYPRTRLDTTVGAFVPTWPGDERAVEVYGPHRPPTCDYRQVTQVREGLTIFLAPRNDS
jgi:hypothetical protein